MRSRSLRLPYLIILLDRRVTSNAELGVYGDMTARISYCTSASEGDQRTLTGNGH